MKLYEAMIEPEQQSSEEREVIKIRCEDEKELSATKEMAIEVHALAGRLFKFFDAEQERLDGNTEFLEDAWRVLRDLWDAGFKLYIEGEEGTNEN